MNKTIIKNQRGTYYNASNLKNIKGNGENLCSVRSYIIEILFKGTVQENVELQKIKYTH